LAGSFRRRGFIAVTELDWWESVWVGGLEVTFVPAPMEPPVLFHHCANLRGSCVLTVAVGLRVYHAGDSAYGPFFAEIGVRYPGIDIAMLPIGAYLPHLFMQAMDMDPEEAAQASATPVPGADADALGTLGTFS
jgi:L-ascorbate metabolism protein UlaG (beta-lactamase superfamily)